jgi:hypothetical protein
VTPIDIAHYLLGSLGPGSEASSGVATSGSGSSSGSGSGAGLIHRMRTIAHILPAPRLKPRSASKVAWAEAGAGAEAGAAPSPPVLGRGGSEGAVGPQAGHGQREMEGPLPLPPRKARFISAPIMKPQVLLIKIISNKTISEIFKIMTNQQC